MTNLTVLDFLSVLTNRRDYCRELLELSRGQSALVQTDDLTELLTVLGKKQRVLGKLDELSKQYPDLARQWQSQRETADPVLKEECEHVLAEMEAIVAELLEEEATSTKCLIKRRDATRQELQAISTGSEVHAAYRDSLAPATNRHLDIDQ
jgi:anion-transporting  ArsA/GET3 family ATPase